MTLLNMSVIILATMVVVLTGMVGYMYWQQNRVLRVVNSLTSYVSTQMVQPDESEDDRISVEVDNDEIEIVEKVEEVEVPVIDSLESKTSGQLKEMLSAKGLPYGKRASKTELIKLLNESEQKGAASTN